MKDEDSRTTIQNLLLSADELQKAGNQLLHGQTTHVNLEEIVRSTSCKLQAKTRILNFHRIKRNLSTQAPSQHNVSFNGFNFYICIKGSFIYANDMAGWDYVTYDSHGYAYLTNCGSFSGCKGLLKVEELRPLLQARSNAQQAKLSNILILMDCLTLVNFMSSKSDYILQYNISLVVLCMEIFCNLNGSC